MVEHLEKIEYKSFAHFQHHQSDKLNQYEHCSEDPYIASFRWFWVSQLAFNLPDQPTVLAFDPNHLSFYSFRDENLKLNKCRVIIIGDKRSFNPKQFDNHIEIYKESSFRLKHHQDQELIILWGKVTGKPHAEMWSGNKKI